MNTLVIDIDFKVKVDRLYCYISHIGILSIFLQFLGEIIIMKLSRGRRKNSW